MWLESNTGYRRPDMYIPVLDHGFVRLVETMGDDSSIVQAARVSTGAGTKTPAEDKRLIRYLYSNKHTTPFEMCEIKLHCKMPIFVARQWVRHRTANVNEMSGRYRELPAEYYVPTPEAVRAQSMINKQGSGSTLSAHDAELFIAQHTYSCAQAFTVYGRAINAGVARELARIMLPVATYTEWYWKIDLHNLLHFLRLRMDEHAQWEIRQYADAIASIVSEWVPWTWEVFSETRIERG